MLPARCDCRLPATGVPSLSGDAAPPNAEALRSRWKGIAPVALILRLGPDLALFRGRWGGDCHPPINDPPARHLYVRHSTNSCADCASAPN